MRACPTRSPSISIPTATETSAKAYDRRSRSLRYVQVLREPARRQLHRENDLIMRQSRIDLRRIARQPVELGKRDRPLAAGSRDVDRRLQCRECHAHVGWVCRDALVAAAENRVNPVHAVDGRTSRTRIALVARRPDIVEVVAASPLEKIAAGGSRVAQLTETRRSGLRGTATGSARPPRGDRRGRHSYQRADAQPASRRRLHAVQSRHLGLRRPPWSAARRYTL